MKILAVASIGGHWIQLLRLLPAFDGTEVIFMSTKPDFAEMVQGFEFHYVPDSNRKNKVQLLKTLVKVGQKIRNIKPDIIISTGAAPGLMAIIIGRIIGCKTVWIDSIANVADISLSGKIATKFANRVYTQWPELADGEIMYEGKTIS